MTEKEIWDAARDGAKIQHEKGGVYYRLSLMKVKIDGKWVAHVSYSDIANGMGYARTPDNFKKFTRVS